MSKENFRKKYDKAFGSREEKKSFFEYFNNDYKDILINSELKYKKELEHHNETLENSIVFMKRAYDFREYIKVNNEKLFWQAMGYCRAKEKDRSDSTLKG